MRREGLDAALSSYLGEREKEREREREESNVQGEPTPTDAYPKASSTSSLGKGAPWRGFTTVNSSPAK